MTGDPAEPARPVDPFDDFIVSEIEHTGESLLRNEEDGERRVTVFLTIAGGAGAALAFLVGDDSRLEPAGVNPLFVSMLLAVLLVGYATFVRVVYRNLASDEYKERLNRARTYFVPNRRDPRIEKYLPFDPYHSKPRRDPSLRSLGKGGWLETTALVNALIAGVLAAVWIPTGSWLAEGIVALAAAALTWVVLILDARRRYENEREEARERKVNAEISRRDPPESP